MATIVDGRFEHLTVLPFDIEKTAMRKGPDGEGGDRPRLTIRGWASTEEEDLDREIVHVGAFDAHLAEFLRNPQMAWQHGWGDSQGLWREIRPEVGKGYWVEGEMIHFGGPEDDRRFAMVEERVVRSLSVGFNARYNAEFGEWDNLDADGYPTRDSRWHWTQNCRLLEVSLCTIPANPGASIALAKAAGLQVVDPAQAGRAGTADEKAALEEARALENVERIKNGSVSLQNIIRHWAKHGGGPSAAVTSAAVSAITAGMDVVKASEVLSAANRADLTQAAELLGGVLQRDAENRARRESEDDKSGATDNIIRLRL